MPVVHAIKRCYPDSYVGWLVQRPFKDLLERDPCIDDVISLSIPSTSEPGAGPVAWLKATLATFRNLYRMRKYFKTNPYDLILDLNASFRSALLSRTNPGGYRIGFSDAREGNPLIQDHLIKVEKNGMHALEKNLLFCKYLQCESQKEDFYLPFNREDNLAAEKFLKKFDIKSSKRIIYFNPAARWETKYWDPKKWALLGDRLTREYDSLILLAGSKGDKRYLHSISQSMGEKAAVTAGELSLPEIAALMNKTAVYVGLDSGPMHMAAMTGVPVVALFGPTNPELVKPFGVENRIISNQEIECLGCRKRNCDSMACMHGISVEQVYNAILELGESAT